MADYQHHPDSFYGIEIRDGWATEDYIAQARHFRSTAEFIQYRDASASRQAEIRANRDNHRVADATDEGEPMRFAALLNLKAK
jgi:hypothetical protein